MKIFKSVFLILSTFLAFYSCQKELSFDNTGVSAGVFQKDAGGNCLPATITGVFKKDSVLTNNLFVDVQVNVSTPGTFDIKSDTINGYSFSKAGSVVFGVNTIRLYPTGTPAAAGNNTFTIKYGTSTCTFTIPVVGSNTGTAVFTLGSGTGGTCTGATTGGVFTAGVQLTPANTLTVQVNVTTPGTYIITTTPSNGFSFSGTGTFTSTGVQNVTLTGTGKPVVAGNTAVSVSNVVSNCTFSITVVAGSGGGGGGGGGGTPASQYYFQFNEGSNFIAADTGTVTAISLSLNGIVSMGVEAFTVSSDTALSVSVATTGNTQTGVAYNTSFIGIPTSMFGATTTSGTVYLAANTTMGQNIAIKFDVIDTVNKIVSGTFSGTAQNAAGGTVTITNGKFRAQLQ